MHIVTSISRSKWNQAMKFSQLIEYKVRKNFLEKSYTECGGGPNPRSFSEKSKLNISLKNEKYLENEKSY